MGVAQQSRRAVAKPTQQLYTVHTSRPDIYDPTVPYNNHLISILLNQTITWPQRERVCMHFHCLLCVCVYCIRSIPCVKSPFSNTAAALYTYCVCVCVCVYKHTNRHLYICVIYIYLFIFLVRRKRRDGVTAPGIRLLLNNLFLYGFLFSSYILLYVCSISVGSIASCVALHIREQNRTQPTPWIECEILFSSSRSAHIYWPFYFPSPPPSFQAVYHTFMDRCWTNGWMDGWMYYVWRGGEVG